MNTNDNKYLREIKKYEHIRNVLNKKIDKKTLDNLRTIKREIYDTEMKGGSDNELRHYFVNPTSSQRVYLII